MQSLIDKKIFLKINISIRIIIFLLITASDIGASITIGSLVSKIDGPLIVPPSKVWIAHMKLFDFRWSSIEGSFSFLVLNQGFIQLERSKIKGPTIIPTSAAVDGTY